MSKRIELLNESQLELLESLICKENIYKRSCALCMEIPKSFPMKNPEDLCAICYCLQRNTDSISNNTCVY